MLLGLERVHRDGNLSRRHDVGQKNEAPPSKLRAIRKVHILGKGVVLPPSRGLDGVTTPNSSGSVEIEEATGAISPAVLQNEMRVERVTVGTRVIEMR